MTVRWPGSILSPCSTPRPGAWTRSFPASARLAGSGHRGALGGRHGTCSDISQRARTITAFLAGFAERGGTDLDSVNALGVADYADLSPAKVLARWRAASADNRRRFHERGDGVVDTRSE